MTARPTADAAGTPAEAGAETGTGAFTGAGADGGAETGADGDGLHVATAGAGRDARTDTRRPGSRASSSAYAAHQCPSGGAPRQAPSDSPGRLTHR